MSTESGWKLIEEDGHYVRLCRKAPPELQTREQDMWETAATLIGCRDGNPDVWLKAPAPGLSRFPNLRGVRFLRNVPDEEAVAIILRAANEAPF